jgi:hypothetical protein
VNAARSARAGNFIDIQCHTDVLAQLPATTPPQLRPLSPKPRLPSKSPLPTPPPLEWASPPPQPPLEQSLWNCWLSESPLAVLGVLT